MTVIEDRQVAESASFGFRPEVVLERTETHTAAFAVLVDAIVELDNGRVKPRSLLLVRKLHSARIDLHWLGVSTLAML